MEHKILIYLLRRDLRLSDNPIFDEISQALSANSEVPFTHLLPLYVFSASQIEISGFRNKVNEDDLWPFPEARSRVGRFWRCGPHRAKFLAESVWDLKESLENNQSGLCIRAGRPEEILKDALDYYDKFEDQQNSAKVVGVWMTAEEGTEEKQEESKIQRVVEEFKKEFRLFRDEKYFVDDDDIPFENINDLPDVFTTYRKSLEPLREKPRKILARPSKLPPFPRLSAIAPHATYIYIPESKSDLLDAVIKPLPDSLELRSPPKWPDEDDLKSKSAHPFIGGETNAKERLKHLVVSGSMTSYKDTRNGLIGLDFSTKLSGYLAIGCLTARQIHAAMCLLEDGEAAVTTTSEDKELMEVFRSTPGFGEGENEGTKTVRFELLWRDYMRLCARKFGSKLFHLDGFRGSTDRKWETVGNEASVESKDKLDRFLSGRTGIGLIDASQRELFLTGYSSNRARQNVANFLAKHLSIDWRLGAEWYESMLIDYDVSSNWGNWQYVAGVGNDPREGRIFNPIKQALDYDPKGEYIKTWIPELRGLDLNDEDGSTNQEKLMGLFQAWRIGPTDKQELNLDNLDWANSPLERIPFSVGRKPRPNNNSNSNNRGRGNHRGRGNFRGWGRGRGRGFTGQSFNRGNLA